MSFLNAAILLLLWLTQYGAICYGPFRDIGPIDYDIGDCLFDTLDCSIWTAFPSEDSGIDGSDIPDIYRRAKSLPLFTKDELNVIYDATAIIAAQIEDDDVVLFLGNSASYFAEMIDQTSFNARSLPISSTRQFADSKKPFFSPTGGKRWFKMFLEPALARKTFRRVILIDHSGSGGSVDGFRNIYHAMIDRYGTDGQKKTWPNAEMVFINILDSAAAQGMMSIKDPKSVDVLAEIYDSGPMDRLNGIVGGKKHPRLTPEYPHEKWAIPKKHCWAPGEEEAANNLKKQMRTYLEENGGKISKTVLPKLKTVKKGRAGRTIKVKPRSKLVKLMLWFLT